MTLFSDDYEMEMRGKCRLWWPKLLLSSKESSSSLLMGWFVTSPASIDIIVAFSCSEVLLPRSSPGLTEILHDINENMPIVLQNKSVFSVLGQCVPSSNNLMVETEDDCKEVSNFDNFWAERSATLYREKFECRSCGDIKLDGSLEQSRQASIGTNYWVVLMLDSREQNDAGNHRIPKLHHIHLNGKTLSQYDVHVIIYETPTYGVHHFGLHHSRSSNQVKTSIKKPKWVVELHKKQQINDMDTAILAVNCAAASKRIFERNVASRSSLHQLSIIRMFFVLLGHLFSKFMATLSTLFYIALQLFQIHFNYESESWIYNASAKVFRTVWINIQIRCCQILYWPIFLQENELRSQSCVEYAEKAAMHRHSMWSTLIVDVLLGNLFGLAVLYHAESVCMSILKFVHDIANPFLRIGCVWLMGNPAGFKLNTELANVLGMVSLNAIQIWSTLWIFVEFIFNYILKGLAILGILCGFTTPAAFIIDMIALSTLHVSTLHWLISLIYSSQIQALAALWRLFRGQKWNPLRQRLDSFDYTMKQHVVGSLLFTPLLLLLPTTSVFYIFFSIVDTTINLISMLIEVTISVIHATPFIKIFLWLVRPGRFPSGIWFEILNCQSNGIVSSKVDFVDQMTSSEKALQQKNANREKYSALVSVLHSNHLSLGEIILPHYEDVFLSGSGPSISMITCGILTGQRMPSRRGYLLPSPMPWMFLPSKEYWCLCHDSLIACFR
ncbi:hypothetical protein L6164_009342 [Bauhinia variegata]|uniref:Uncharacterized protein n=1 Tax=Bauhinia variegata TaxID=167791 RepID=A0ACB9PIL6_BAUVA|nr:hypothetical protein L6164_009342 [Bauhinia variegata]